MDSLILVSSVRELDTNSSPEINYERLVIFILAKRLCTHKNTRFDIHSHIFVEFNSLLIKSFVGQWSRE